MAKDRKFREVSKFFLAFKNFITYFKKEILYSSIAVLFGIVIGVVIISTNGSEVAIENIFDKNIFLVLTEHRHFFTVFIWHALYFLLAFAIVYLLCRKRWCIIFPLIILFIVGFSIGYHTTIMIVLFGFWGFINAVVIILPFDLIIATCLVFICAIFIRKCLITHKYGCSYFQNNCPINHSSVLKFILITGLIAMFLKSLLMPIIRITIIIS